MKVWEVTYTFDKTNFDTIEVVAPTYTTALVEFMCKVPNAEYHIVREVMGNESEIA